MAAPMAILAQPDDHRGILAMSEAVDAMLESLSQLGKGSSYWGASAPDAHA